MQEFQEKLNSVLSDPESMAQVMSMISTLAPLMQNVGNADNEEKVKSNIDINKNKIVYTITSAGKLFSEVIDTIKILQSRGIEIYIASGDRKGAINKLAEILNVNKKHAFGTVSPKGKCKVVRCLKDRGYKVMMVGDGLNDVLAFNNADVSVLTVEQEEEVSPKLVNKTDYVIQKISEVISIDF